SPFLLTEARKKEKKGTMNFANKINRRLVMVTTMTLVVFAATFGFQHILAHEASEHTLPPPAEVTYYQNVENAQRSVPFELVALPEDLARDFQLIGIVVSEFPNLTLVEITYRTPDGTFAFFIESNGTQETPDGEVAKGNVGLATARV